MRYLLLVIFPFFFLGGPGAHGSRSFVAAWDLGHVFFFTVFTIILCKEFHARSKRLSILVINITIFLAVLAIGLAVELLQTGFDGRSPSLHDLLRNQLGWLVGMIFFCLGKQDIKLGRFLFFVRLFVFLLLGVVLSPLLRALTDEYIARGQFPLLSGFETPFECERWKRHEQVSLQQGISRNGQNSMLVQLTTETYSGVSLVYFQRDWRDYATLHVSVFNSDEDAFVLVCRIHDSVHNNEYNDRFNREYLLQPGWNDFLISLDEVKNAPAERRMDMAQIQNLKLFVVRQERGRVIYVDSVFLRQ